MQTLRLGSIGEDVFAWQDFLLGINPNSDIVADGVFGPATFEETRTFQKKVSLVIDGVVGPRTYGKAQELGFDPTIDDSIDESGPHWPPRPNVRPLSSSDRERLFGRIEYVPAPVEHNKEAIKITNGWDRDNIVRVMIPQLSKVMSNTWVMVHKDIAPQLRSLFTAWEEAGLTDRLLTWGGLWVPQFIRGSRSTLSAHSWGTAFDVNVQWNMLGTRPALVGKRGSVRELVPIAIEHGFFWGGHFGYMKGGRSDGMHFECFDVKPSS